ncbi:hypothetical protein RHMOL_Rhmol06G0238100 [Rhododendron molle]|uniref:Uncharacterized protein n=1 Tax=Rhododendron molle TaxID=49168 RepID=A0ACC0NFF7_RHOML|nr:hypothetical protein RHMOL_Rhmol06G0238100 [Rhododendron molle]
MIELVVWPWIADIHIVLQLHSIQSSIAMGSKTFVLLGFLLATALLIASEVTARDLVETSTLRKTSESIYV